ncbi:MAG: chorismate mutase, partial [Treponema sp.]|nr:chorismate mutase [Treponema sp.]
MNIDEVRRKIDDIDDQMLDLFEQRMKIAKEIGQYKKEKGLPLKDRERERKILYRLCEKAPPELAEYARALFVSLIEMSGNYQTLLNLRDSAVKRLIEKALENTQEAFPSSAVVACQGVEGAYSQAACDRLFPLADITYFNSFEAVFQAVNQGLCRYGILPLEN